MFDKLKRKVVIINMSLLTIVFVTIFSVIYMLTAIAGDRQTEFALNNIMYAPPRPFPDNPVVATSMVAELDKQGRIVNTFSFMNINEEVINKAVSQAVKKEAFSGKIKTGDTYYAFLKHNTPNGTKLVFVDRTPQHRTLMNLLLIFVIVGGISLVLLFLISIYFANKSIQPIKEVFEKQKQFTADASHELKTPLTVIKTNLALITANSEETVKSQAKWIEYIWSQTDRMSNLVDDMLALAKLDYMETKPVFSRFDLSQTLTSTMLSFEAILFENHITLDTRIQPDVLLHGDKDSIKKVISILIDNAIKNTSANGRISVELTGDKNKIKISVTNTGPGIPAKHLEKIFERFYRMDTSRGRENGGYGLGLAIAKSIVEQHQGRIYATSNPGVDTSFTVELPHN
ncbi:MAG: HAMP domain-containing sensor histidine kinase [Syntrophomonadaceae bacterium]|nr:HAMP domain-containing sensor histidine kinase [Syntrophomonadaceae bacterium]MDD4550217.1 HAMP domain-containing sensor histidine kinase [Syntrophomonadaceae bacterium]